MRAFFVFMMQRGEHLARISVQSNSVFYREMLGGKTISYTLWSISLWTVTMRKFLPQLIISFSTILIYLYLYISYSSLLCGISQTELSTNRQHRDHSEQKYSPSRLNFSCIIQSEQRHPFLFTPGRGPLEQNMKTPFSGHEGHCEQLQPFEW